MSWHYQICKRQNGPYTYYDIAEVYTDPFGYTEASMAPAGGSPDGVITVLEMMLSDAKKYPVLEPAS